MAAARSHGGREEVGGGLGWAGVWAGLGWGGLGWANGWWEWRVGGRVGWSSHVPFVRRSISNKCMVTWSGVPLFEGLSLIIVVFPGLAIVTWKTKPFVAGFESQMRSSQHLNTDELQAEIVGWPLLKSTSGDLWVRNGRQVSFLQFLLTEFKWMPQTN